MIYIKVVKTEGKLFWGESEGIGSALLIFNLSGVFYLCGMPS